MEQHLIDSSVWIEFFNARPSKARDRIRSLAVDDPDSIRTSQPVLMELRAGVNGTKLARVEGTLNRFAELSVQSSVDFHAAADLYRAARRTGRTVRSMVDCLIAAVAIRTGAVLLHRDRDFDVLADIATDLRCVSAVE